MTSPRRGDPAPTPPDVTVREATVEDLPGVLSVLDAAALETDVDRTKASIDGGGTLVAVGNGERTGRETDGTTVLGALVLDGEEIDAVAVRPGRRGQGIGTALVRAAAERRERLVAEFRAGVRPFYEELGFRVESLSEPGRCRGTLEPGEASPSGADR